MGYLDVGDGHTMYYETHGNPNGKPAVVIHGGPGGGLERFHLRYFDLDKWYVVLFDQRGCGHSMPAGSLTNNTTWHLVEDIERLRNHLHIHKWMVVGGSWGTTLGLAYSQTYPKSVSSMVLRGVALLDKNDHKWLYEYGASEIFPAEWEKFLKPIRGMKQKNNTLRYKSLLANTKTRKNAAKAWWGWEASVSHMKPKPDVTRAKSVEEIAIIENHYFSHKAWLKPNQLLNRAHMMKIPTTIVQGRYDLVCPMRNAWKLKKAMGSYAKLRIVPDAGHSGSEPGTMLEMKKAIASYL